MRIAIYGESFPPDGSGGIAAAHWQLGQQLKASHQVRYFAFADPRIAPPANILRDAPGGFQSRILAWGITRFVRRYDRSGNVENCTRIARVAPAIRRLNRGLADFAPEVIIVSDHSLPALALRKPPAARMIWVAHHNYARFRHQPLLEGPSDYDRFLAHRLERRAVRKADFAVFPSVYMQGVFRESLGGSPAGRVIANGQALPEGSPARRARVRAGLGLAPQDVLIYVPSGGSNLKGARYVPALIQRLSRGNPAVAFYVSGPAGDAFRWELEHMGPGLRVIAPGHLDHEKNLDHVSACDFALSPALMENYSCALLEAQACGVPCVAFDVGGNREVVADGQSGFILPFLDLEALAEKASLLLGDASLRDQLSQGARAHVAQVADPERLIGAWNEVFEQTVGSSHHGQRQA